MENGGVLLLYIRAKLAKECCYCCMRVEMVCVHVSIVYLLQPLRSHSRLSVQKVISITIYRHNACNLRWYTRVRVNPRYLVLLAVFMILVLGHASASNSE